MKEKKQRFLQRRKRVRAKVFGTKGCPRLSVHCSNKAIYAQIINDVKGETVVASSSFEVKDARNKTEQALLVGEILGKKAKLARIKKVVFDKSGYKYHGRVKALADGARRGGLEF